VVVAETERLLLRRFTPADVEHLYELDSDPEVMHYLTNGKPTPLAVVEGQLLPRILDDYERSPGLGRWAVVEKASGEFVGWVALKPREDDGHTAGLGYRLKRAAWGRGYATEASKAVVDKGFAGTALERVVAETMFVNTASRRVMEKVGLRHLRTFHESWEDPIEGTELGEVEYGLTRAEWEARARAEGERA
jgi:RimJ/RimL family protein N-acetyltransferase